MLLRSSSPSSHTSGSFNPHRPRRAGAAEHDAHRAPGQGPVSILTGPEGPVLPEDLLGPLLTLIVSILTGPEGPVLRQALIRVYLPRLVSILTGPEGPVLQESVIAAMRKHLEVSILTGPEGPVLPQVDAPRPVEKLEFQSSPAPKGRCCLRRAANPGQRGPVSILTGPEGPVLPTPQTAPPLSVSKFQSSPAPKGRCCSQLIRLRSTAS